MNKGRYIIMSKDTKGKEKKKMSKRERRQRMVIILMVTAMLLSGLTAGASMF